ncbi:MAG: NAD(P)H-hydrate dehydratase [Treponema sp.]|nr:NAD(P)H-hydrate dehydratase [Treponema sp.]
MRKLFGDTRVLDAACRDHFCLTEEIMMENAARALEAQVMKSLSCSGGSGWGGIGGGYGECDTGTCGVAWQPKGAVLILCGAGNNGADGYALARRLSGKVRVCVFPVQEPKSPQCVLQAKRAALAGVQLAAEIDGSSFSVIVDCIFGSGFHGELDAQTKALLQKVNEQAGAACVSTTSANASVASVGSAVFAGAHVVRIACDVPTGLREDGTISPGAFVADITVTMGAEKLSLYSDAAKDFVGTVITADLGVSRQCFESAAPGKAFLLERSDMELPFRRRKTVHKGVFGHLAVACGEKAGAACIAGLSALRFGSGLVTLVRADDASFSLETVPQLSPELMASSCLPGKTTALAVGMGLGRLQKAPQPYFDWLSAHPSVPCVIDADACYADALPDLLAERPSGIVLTPHPREFSALLSVCGIADSYTADYCLSHRPELMEAFCRKYPGAVLLVKGAVVMIGTFAQRNMQLYVNPYGAPSLAKAGSGDVLSGLIGALLAQGYESTQAAVSASLAHAFASSSMSESYSLTPLALMDAVASLGRSTNCASVACTFR